jgi:hypothetical protein
MQLNGKSQEHLFEETQVDDRMNNNPLVYEIGGVLGRVKLFKDRARQFYYEVVLAAFSCPVCGGRLNMSKPGECVCSCGNVFDPTLAFQKSTCCGAHLVRKTFHYSCARCHNPVPSRFLFDERIFDKNYFREMMREYRNREKNKREAIRQLLAESRSDVLPLTENPDLEAIPGLIQDLNDFIRVESYGMDSIAFNVKPEFSMDGYRDHINSILSWDCMLFSNIDPLIDDFRNDKIWRFVTLIFMQNDREVDLTQHGNDILIQRAYNEANA